MLLLPLLATQPLGWLLEPTGLALALYLGVATMAIANVLLARGIRGLTAGPATTLMLADPVVATILGVLVLGETLAPVAVLGMLLVLAGLLLHGQSRARMAPVTTAIPCLIVVLPSIANMSPRSRYVTMAPRAIPMTRCSPPSH